MIHRLLYSPLVSQGWPPAPWQAILMLVIMLGALAWGVLLLVRVCIAAGCIHPAVEFFKGIDEVQAWYWCGKCRRYLRGPALIVKQTAAMKGMGTIAGQNVPAVGVIGPAGDEQGAARL